MIAQRILQRAKSPGGVLGFALCVLGALLWIDAAPRLVGGEIVVPLGENPPPIFTEGEFEVRRVTILDEGGKDAIWDRVEWRTYELDLPGAGRYSVYGVTTVSSNQPLKLKINGVLVSWIAFYANPEDDPEHPRRVRIETGVLFKEKANVVHLEGSALLGRSLALVLRREAPFAYTRYLASLGLLVCVYVMGLAIPFRNPASGAGRIALTAGSFVFVLVAVPLLAAGLRGHELSGLGMINPEFGETLMAFEWVLESNEHARRRAEKWNIVALGDSTHYLHLDPADSMIPALRGSIPNAHRDQTYVYGISSGGFSAFDYYFLLNRIAPEHPDLVIIPASQRWFSDQRMYSMDLLNFYYLESYLPFDEYLHVLPLQVGSRGFTLGRLLYNRFGTRLKMGDRSLLGVLIGSHVWVHRINDFWNARYEKRVSNHFTPIPPLFFMASTAVYSNWADDIGPDHDFFKMYRQINRLAAKRGIKILYYSVNQNVEAQLEKGNDFKLPENTAVIRRAVTTAAHVYFLDLARENPPEIFYDDNDHLTPEGIRGVAQRLMDASLYILQDGDFPTTIPDLARGPLE